MSHSALIRDATRDDAAQLHGLIRAHAEYEGEPFSPDMTDQPDVEQLADYLFGERQSVRCLVVVEGDRIVGYTTFVLQEATWQAERYLFMDCLFLAEEARGQGIGATIMNRLQDEAREL